MSDPEESSKLASPPRPSSPPAPVAGRKRPRIDLSTSLGTGGSTSGEGRKRAGKSMFGLALSTLAKAKTDTATLLSSGGMKQRAQVESRLQTRLRAEKDIIQKGEDVKKDRIGATRKEEDTVLRDSLVKLQTYRLPTLASFLITTDDIREESKKDVDEDAEMDIDDKEKEKEKAPPKGPKGDISRAAQAPRRHPPPVYYLPKKLLPIQEDFINKRKAEVTKAVDADWEAWTAERPKIIEEIEEMRKRSAKVQEELKETGVDEDEDPSRDRKRRRTSDESYTKDADEKMEADNENPGDEKPREEEKKDEEM
ncbi:hypothetical protein DL96DRAFT_1600199 [Flagelloscypha sp. PMI_526]|nr:hypothetical protein DL96DRAFT_1600199 [Flagelloscypha sp. PMI_526]